MKTMLTRPIWAAEVLIASADCCAALRLTEALLSQLRQHRRMCNLTNSGLLVVLLMSRLDRMMMGELNTSSCYLMGTLK